MNTHNRNRTLASASSARKVAVTVLVAVDEADAYANILLNQQLRTANLSPSDAGFATELVSGTLRMRSLYDAIIEHVTERNVAELDVLTLNIIRMGTHQLLELKTGAHAAVNESVELQRQLGKQSATGFVNGVLRRISQRDRESWLELLETSTNSSDAKLALRYSHPEWVIRALRDALAAEDCEAELVNLLDADNRSPRVNLVVLPGGHVDPNQLRRLLAERTIAEVGPSPLGFELEHGSPRVLLDDVTLAPEGTVRVQDQGSQLAALSLTNASPVAAREDWLDLCAGPGGKTALLADAAASHSATLRAVELSEHRTSLVRDAVRANSAAVEIVTADGTSAAAFAGRLYDRILVDAPCTGLGALRRRPEARHKKSPADVAQLSTLQTQLLNAAIEHLKPGGVIAYVTCSPHIAETRVVVDRATREHPELIELDAKAVVQSIAREDLKLAGPQRSAQLWPHRNNTDAMFIALLQRRLDA